MVSPMKTCRTCGKEYKACKAAKSASGAFRWQDVACSPECGAIYLSKIEESRATPRVNTAPAVKRARKKSVDLTIESTVEIDVANVEDAVEQADQEDDSLNV